MPALMRRWRPDFKSSNNNGESWYDLIDDWELIEASFTQQYGIRLSRDEMDWWEFQSKLQLLNETTPLGQVVCIRSESDPEILKNFTKDQKRIRNDYLKKNAKNMDKKEYDDAMNAFKEMFKAMSISNKNN